MQPNNEKKISDKKLYCGAVNNFVFVTAQYLNSCKGNEGDTAGGVEDDMDEAVAGLGIAGQQENGQP